MPSGMPQGHFCVQWSIDSRNSAIHNAYRTSLRPSSLFEPRHPSLKVVSNLFSGSPLDDVTVWPKQPGKVQRRARQQEQSRKTVRPHPAALELLAGGWIWLSWWHNPPSPHLEPEPHKRYAQWFVWMRANDPSAGSPTETLLRLLLPLSDKVH